MISAKEAKTFSMVCNKSAHEKELENINYGILGATKKGATHLTLNFIPLSETIEAVEALGYKTFSSSGYTVITWH